MKIVKMTSYRYWVPAAALFMAIQSPAWAHAFLYYSIPKAGSTLTNAPSEIKICFTENVQPEKCTIQVQDAKGREVDKKDVHGDSKDKSLLFVSLPKLPSGTYKVLWHAVSEDQHETKGDFEFTLKRAAEENDGSSTTNTVPKGAAEKP